MMQAWRELLHPTSINRKVANLYGLSIFLAVIVCGLFLLFYEIANFRARAQAHLLALRDVIAVSVFGAVEFNDERTAMEMLSSLQSQTDILRARLYLPDGYLFAHFPASVPPAEDLYRSALPEQLLVQTTDQGMKYFSALRKNNRTFAYLELESSLASDWARLRATIFQLLLFFIVFILLVLLLSRILQRWITQPILELTRIAESISQNADYRMRAHLSSTDEIGILAGSFNKMLEALQENQTALQRYQEHLEVMVRERTAQLEEAQRELLRRERLSMLGQLTATVSHEMRNPLGTVRNSLYNIREGLLKQKPDLVQRALQLADRNIQRCDTIIEELLDYTRRRELQRKPVALDAWIHSVLEEFKIPENIVLQENLQAGDLTLEIDPFRLQRTLINVINNAFQAVRETENPVKVVAVRTGTENGRFFIRVEDNGPGLSEEARRRIFEPLFSTKSFGVGLGMVVVKDVIEAHGGSVEIASQPNQGASVTLWLPLPGPR